MFIYFRDSMLTPLCRGGAEKDGGVGVETEDQKLAQRWQQSPM